MAAKTSVLGLILSSYSYLRSAMVRFPLYNINANFLCVQVSDRLLPNHEPIQMLPAKPPSKVATIKLAIVMG